MGIREFSMVSRGYAIMKMLLHSAGSGVCIQNHCSKLCSTLGLTFKLCQEQLKMGGWGRMVLFVNILSQPPGGRIVNLKKQDLPNITTV